MRMRWTENWHVWREGRLIEGLAAKTEEERILARPRHRGKGNIIMGLQEVGWEIVLD
jgi:hypothetical protein